MPEAKIETLGDWNQRIGCVIDPDNYYPGDSGGAMGCCNMPSTGHPQAEYEHIAFYAALDYAYYDTEGLPYSQRTSVAKKNRGTATGNTTDGCIGNGEGLPPGEGEVGAEIPIGATEVTVSGGQGIYILDDILKFDGDETKYVVNGISINDGKTTLSFNPGLVRPIFACSEAEPKIQEREDVSKSDSYNPGARYNFSLEGPEYTSGVYSFQENRSERHWFEPELSTQTTCKEIEYPVFDYELLGFWSDQYTSTGGYVDVSAEGKSYGYCSSSGNSRIYPGRINVANENEPPVWRKQWMRRTYHNTSSAWDGWDFNIWNGWHVKGGGEASWTCIANPAYDSGENPAYSGFTDDHYTYEKPIAIDAAKTAAISLAGALSFSDCPQDKIGTGESFSSFEHRERKLVGPDVPSDDERRLITQAWGRKVRVRFRIPGSFTGSYFKITWDVVTMPNNRYDEKEAEDLHYTNWKGEYDFYLYQLKEHDEWQSLVDDYPNAKAEWDTRQAAFELALIREEAYEEWQRRKPVYEEWETIKETHDQWLALPPEERALTPEPPHPGAAPPHPGPQPETLVRIYPGPEPEDLSDQEPDEPSEPQAFSGPAATLEKDFSVTWSGPGTGAWDDPSWLTGWTVIEHPIIPANRFVVNRRYEFYRDPDWGNKPQVWGGAFELEEETEEEA
jgi:hypothetical protein